MIIIKSLQMQESPEAQIEEIFNIIDKLITQKPLRKNLENEVNKQLKKIKHLLSVSKGTLSDQFKRSVNTREKKIRQELEKIKPIYLTQEQKLAAREQIVNVIKQLEKKIASLDEKKGNKKRQANIQFFREHITKLAKFSDWLESPSRRFHHQTTQQLLSKIKDLMLSADDAIFQEDLQAIYKKIQASANQPAELSHSQFLTSYKNRPQINDYLLTKQTKETLPRNPLLPHYKMIDLSIIPEMEKEVIFFMFYYHKGETEQYLAAKQLMKRSWRFYKKVNVWLKRNSNPTFDGAEYQTGNYISMSPQLNSKQRSNIKVYHNFLLKNL